MKNPDHYDDLHDNARQYYGQTLASSRDLRTSACCPLEGLPRHHRPLLAKIAEEILERFYGCGSPMPEAMEGLRVLDLGCGTGRDVYLAAQLVGEEGEVIGVDMTEEQLEVARRHEDSQRERFGYARSNVSLRQGVIEDLATVGIEDASVDLVISNCVVNLSPDKEAVLAEIFRVLKPGGELYFSDVYASRRVPTELREDPVLHGECLSGALYGEDFRRLLARLGCPDYRLMNNREIVVTDPTLAARLGPIRFFSRTVRAFKLEGLEDRCEDYGQVATYVGGLPEAEHSFVLDEEHQFERDRPVPVCGNTALMLTETRFGRYFQLEGCRGRHFGLFDCDREKAALDVASERGTCC